MRLRCIRKLLSNHGEKEAQTRAKQPVPPRKQAFSATKQGNKATNNGAIKFFAPCAGQKQPCLLAGQGYSRPNHGAKWGYAP
jgi:hypothetical protein